MLACNIVKGALTRNKSHGPTSNSGFAEDKEHIHDHTEKVVFIGRFVTCYVATHNYVCMLRSAHTNTRILYNSNINKIPDYSVIHSWTRSRLAELMGSLLHM